METTDYSKIASKYDKNEYRQKIEPDSILIEYIEQNVQSEYNILEIIELSTKPTWNSSELTVEDIKSICKSNSNKKANRLKNRLSI